MFHTSRYFTWLALPRLVGWLVGECQQRAGLHSSSWAGSDCWPAVSAGLVRSKWEPRGRLYLFAFHSKILFLSSGLLWFSKQGWPRLFHPLGAAKTQGELSVPISVWCIFSSLQLAGALCRGPAWGTLNQHPHELGLPGAWGTPQVAQTSQSTWVLQGDLKTMMWVKTVKNIKLFFKTVVFLYFISNG